MNGGLAGATAAPHLPALRIGPLLSYAALGLPLALLATPLNLFVPKFYAEQTGLSLTLIAAVLFGTRLVDAIVDPVLGSWVDAQKHAGQYWRPIWLAALPLAAGFIALFNPPPGLTGIAAALWLAGSIVLTYIAYSLATVAYQGWGSELASDDSGRARITASREGLGLIGVICAALLQQQFGIDALTLTFIALLVIGLFMLGRHAPRPAGAGGSSTSTNAAHVVGGFRIPLASARFRWLLLVFALNAIVPSITATLFQFFVADRLGLAQHVGTFLALYFLAGAVSMPAWIWLAQRYSLHVLWFAGMLAAIASFVGAYSLGTGDFNAFAVICVLSGLAFGADLALPPALLARVIDANQHRGEREGVYFGLWNFVNKLTFAIAALLALPTLEFLGYKPGGTDAQALAALSFSYAVLPCGLKLLAAALLLVAWRGKRF